VGENDKGIGARPAGKTADQDAGCATVADGVLGRMDAPVPTDQPSRGGGRGARIVAITRDAVGPDEQPDIVIQTQVRIREPDQGVRWEVTRWDTLPGAWRSERHAKGMITDRALRAATVC